jgi:hypothetical protein
VVVRPYAPTAALLTLTVIAHHRVAAGARPAVANDAAAIQRAGLVLIAPFEN